MIKKNHFFLLLFGFAMLFQKTYAQTAFTPGNIVVYRVGSGVGSLVNTGNAVFMDEYTTAGVLVQSVALPTAVSGADKRLIASGTATSEGGLARSADGSCLLLTGYDATPGGATSLSGTTAASVNRVVGIVYANGTVDTKTALTDFASANNPRSAISSNGTDIWVTGGAGGVRYTTAASTTSSDLSSATLANLRVVQIFDNQLYFSTASGTTYRIGTVGTGLPTSGLQTLTHLTGIPNTTGSPYGYFMADLDGVPGVDVIYVADDGANALRKYSLVAGTWTLNGTIGVDADDYRGVTGTVNGSTVTLYCTRKGGSGISGGGEIVTLTDASGYNGAFSGSPVLLFTAATNTAIRGIALAPEAICTPSNWYADADGDNFGDVSVSVSACIAPLGYVADATDCNDADSLVNPSAAEICNSVDDNCDGIVDEDFVNPIISFASSVLAAGLTGPSSSQNPYLTPLKPGVQFTSVLTANDNIGGYTAVGLMDGLGAYDNGDGTFTILVNHEIGSTLGVVRDHGFIGTFVSKWIVNIADLSVVSGSDLMQNAFVWNTTTNSYDPASAAFSRFCSADLPVESAFYNAVSGNGTQERIFMNGEESGNEGRQFAHIVTGPNAGNSYELPHLGKAGWENSVANPTMQDKTIVAELDDNTTNGQVYFYIGTKTNSGIEIDKAGLTNGNIFGVIVSGLGTESSLSVPAPGTAFSLTNLGSVQNLTGATLNTNSITAGVTNFLRPEDGVWDLNDASIFYFVTTNSFTAPSRLWKLDFTDITNPELGGTITALLEGTEGQKMFDNITIDNYGNLIIQEDPGNQKYLARIWEYNIATDALIEIAKHDDSRFIVGGANYLTQDEESSGIIDVSSILGPGMFLIDDQAHYAITGEVVEGGQLLVMYNPDSETGIYTATDTVNLNTNTACSATGASLGTPITSDNCMVASVTNDAPAAFPLGTTTVTWTVTDAYGNMTTGTQIVIVTDAVLPTITAPAAISIAADITCSATGVVLGTPITADNCGVASVTNNAPAIFPLGATTVTWTVTDINGNVITATQIVTVTGTQSTYYADVDGDTYGDLASTTLACLTPAGYVLNSTDCNDGNSTINPGATEICNGIDDNCDGTIDEGVETTFYADADGDSYGDAASTTLACSVPVGYVTDNTDCNDTNTAVNPGATEICNGIDDNCDGNTDDNVIEAAITPAGPTSFCKGGNVTLNANSGVGYTYQWKRNGNIIAAATNAFYATNKAGSYTVSVTIPGGCSDESAITNITVLSTPNPIVTNLIGTTNLCGLTSIKLKVNGGAGLSYQWHRNGTPIIGATNITYFVTTVGNYFVVVTNTATGCSKNSAHTIITNSCKETDVVSNKEGMQIYPNPTSSTFNVDLTITNATENTATIIVYNMIGEVVYQNTASVIDNNMQAQVSLDNVVSGGMYIVKVIAGNKTFEKNVVITK